MAKNSSKKVAFKISSRTARMLGRQNVSNQYVAVIELIKNAYDADSNDVEIQFKLADTSEGEIVIRDYGSGMDLSTLEASWLTLGTDYKERKPVSDGGRVRTGAKGIGRFALDRLGNIGILETFDAPNRDGIRITIDWSKYDDNSTNFESITHELEYIENLTKITGTTLKICGLRDMWGKFEYEALREDLTFLVPPLDNYKSGFEINLNIDSFPELSGVIKPLVKEAAEYELISSLSEEGKVKHLLIHKKDGQKVEQEKAWNKVLTSKNVSRLGRLFSSMPSCGPVELHMLFFLRASNEERNLDFNLSSLRRYLDVFSGIRIYRDGFQVKPYGSKGNDWLGLNARKTKSPEGVGQDLGKYRVSSNQLVGTVSVGRDKNSNLEDKANREGIIETGAFQDLKDFILDSIQYLEIQRQIKEQANFHINKNDDKRLKVDFDKLTKSFDDLIIPPLRDDKSEININVSEKKEIELRPNETIVSKKRLVEFKGQMTELQVDLEAKLEENQLLRALATIGIALSTFSHEIQASVSSISNQITLTKHLLKTLPEPIRVKADERLDIGLFAAERIQEWSNYVLESVQAGHRVEQELSFLEVLNRILEIFKSSFEFRSIEVNKEVDPSIPRFLAFPIDLEAILINLISNSVKALESGVPLDKRKIIIGAIYNSEENMLHIEFMDSGNGIDIKELPNQRKGIRQVFDPFTTASGQSGTGMGLAVVSKVINGLGGVITVEGKGLLGGANFIIDLPLKTLENSNRK